MAVAKTVLDIRGNMLLPAGTEAWPFIEQLKNVNIKYLYIDDEISTDVETWSILSEETRKKLPALMDEAKKQYQHIEDGEKFDTTMMIIFKEMAILVSNDILSNKEIRIDATELFTNNVFSLSHELNVAIIAGLFGRMMGLPDIKNICLAGFLHDIGKLALPEEIRLKLENNQPLTSMEEIDFKDYPSLGFDMLEDFLEMEASFAVYHQSENYDGSGFPLSKREEDIPLSAQIIAFANAFDELFSLRKLRTYEVVEWMQKHSGTKFNPKLVKMFAKNTIPYPNGTIVYLSDRRKGIVIQQNQHFVARPVVKIINSEKPEMVNLLEDLTISIDDIDM